MAQQGVGLYLVSDENDALMVKSLIPGGDAAASGLVKPNDVLYSINGNMIHRAPLKVVKDLILGPAGSEVTLGLLRNKNLVEVTLRRGLGFGPPLDVRESTRDSQNPRNSRLGLPPPPDNASLDMGGTVSSIPPTRSMMRDSRDSNYDRSPPSVVVDRKVQSTTQHELRAAGISVGGGRPPAVGVGRGGPGVGVGGGGPGPVVGGGMGGGGGDDGASVGPGGVLPCGIGILLIPDANRQLTVVGMNPGGPAKRCGQIKIGDILHSVDNEIVLGMRVHEVRPLILGPPGSEVTVCLQRPGQQGLVTVRLTRARMRSNEPGGPPPSDATSLRSSVSSTTRNDSGTVLADRGDLGRRSLDSATVSRMGTRIGPQGGPGGPPGVRGTVDGAGAVLPPSVVRSSMDRQGGANSIPPSVIAARGGADYDDGYLPPHLSHNQYDDMPPVPPTHIDPRRSQNNMNNNNMNNNMNNNNNPATMVGPGRHSMDSYVRRTMPGNVGGGGPERGGPVGGGGGGGEDEVGGIGVLLLPENGGAFYVKGLTPGGCAARDGQLRVGDIVRQINGRSITGATMDNVRSLVKGPPGSTITLGVTRRTPGADPTRLMQISLIRESFASPFASHNPMTRATISDTRLAGRAAGLSNSSSAGGGMDDPYGSSANGNGVDDHGRPLYTRSSMGADRSTHIGLSRSARPMGQSESDRRVGVGIILIPDAAGSLVVKGFVPGGPAERCGRIMRGDVLYEIDSKKVFGMPIPAVRPFLLGPPASLVTLGLQRGRERNLVTVTLQRDDIPRSDNNNVLETVAAGLRQSQDRSNDAYGGMSDKYMSAPHPSRSAPKQTYEQLL